MPSPYSLSTKNIHVLILKRIRYCHISDNVVSRRLKKANIKVLTGWSCKKWHNNTMSTMTTIVYQSIQFELLQKSIDDKYEKIFGTDTDVMIPKILM